MHENVLEIGGARDFPSHTGRPHAAARLSTKNHKKPSKNPSVSRTRSNSSIKEPAKPKVWYWRAESGYEFYDAPGFHPRTGEVLTGITRDVINDWQQSQTNATQCYIIQRDRAPRSYTATTCLGSTQRRDASAGW